MTSPVSAKSKYPKKPQVAGEVECPECGKTVKLWVEADGWSKDDNGKWQVDSYGPAVAFHCGLLLAETDYDGNVGVFDLRKTATLEGKNQHE